MADLKLSALAAVTTNVTTDEYYVNQGGTSKKVTRLQLLVLESGEKLVAKAGTDLVLKLGDAAGANKLSITDSADVEVVNIDSIGQLHLDKAQTYGNTTGIVFGAGTAGIFEASDNVMTFRSSSVDRFNLTNGTFAGNSSAGPAILNQNASATNPTLAPDRGNTATGVGARTDKVGVLIGDAQNCLEFGGVGAVPELGFYGTAAIAKLTGVAVTAAGIHAALVSLGLIAA